MSSMRAIRISETGGPERLTLQDVPQPAPNPNELLIRVEAIGVNYIDTYHRTGLYRLDLPFTPGVEAA
ncbi:MAG TPA: quinone oxidoreductase, partial [Bryobacteraceae bacterium]|nr:quinone oxidoreductase [Bryobacteraceae bacterium]